ncbi:MAG TPA: methionine--tRNA ligase [Polyangiaceae bacterium]|nr:methionine--tRNA ligase [Polyangiaceae bacterium]
MSTQFISTAIPYVNGAPHLGHAQELVIADAVARHRRRFGGAVHFQSGSDDNSLKCWRAAAEAGCPPAELVARSAAEFRALARSLDVTLDDFLQTSSDPRHAPAVAKLWRACAAAGDLYRRTYRGLFCAGCEQFFAPNELAGNVCPDHAQPLEVVEEENYFFRASRYSARVLAAIEQGALRIEPETRRREVTTLLAGGLEDFSVSRSARRAHGWGIPVPGDADQVVFVWFDALANYVSALGYAEDASAFERFWRLSDERTHVIGKGILRFHAAVWPALLLSAGLPLPTEILSHGYVTAEGRKIGKSLGNARPARELVERFGVNAFRYYALRHLHTTADTDFSEQRLVVAHDAELADQLGNLLSRTLALVVRGFASRVPDGALDGEAESALLARADAAFSTQVEAFARFDLNTAVASAVDYVARVNAYVSSQAPWTLAKQGEHSRLASVLRAALEALRRAAWLLEPIVPDASRRLAHALGGEAFVRSVSAECVQWLVLEPGAPLTPVPPLFPKLRERTR